MDKEKDISKSDVLVKFIEHQYVKSSPFGENKVGERAYRRAEKIATAIILLTNHIGHDEPIRTAVRKTVSELIAQMLNVRDEMRSPNSENIQLVKVSLRTLISYIKFLAISGYISFQNAEVVSEGLDDLAGFMNSSQRSNMSERASFSRDDLSDAREVSRTDAVHKDADPKASGVSEYKEIDRDASMVAQIGERPQGIAPISGSLTSRAASIIDVLRERGGDVGIKDIASHLPEYSEKMIQRELSELVERGLVTKQGLKRWSRYSARKR